MMAEVVNVCTVLSVILLIFFLVDILNIIGFSFLCEGALNSVLEK